MPSSSSVPPQQAKAVASEAGAVSRVGWGMGALAVVTTAGLCFAWWHPQDTLWHFLVVTQLIPLFYLGLSWWTAVPRSKDSDHV